MKMFMNNEWILKYKKLKNDLENKAATIKDMEELSEKNIAELKESYGRTSLMLESWLLEVVTALETAQPEQMSNLSKGNLNPELEAGFNELLTAYANDFSTQYEEVTGLTDNFVLSMNAERAETTNASPSTIKFEKNELLAGVKQLLPNDWNSVN
jgi:hypothetical protein